MNWIAVAIGGALGACLRYSIALSMSDQATRFPMATFTANAIGCFLMGVGYVFLLERTVLPDPWRHFLLVGILGALTTYSTFAIEVVGLLNSQEYKLAMIYVFITTCVCLIAVFAGSLLAKTLFN